VDLSLTPAHEALRRRLRTWLAANLPRSRRDDRSVEYGGQGADVLEQTIVDDELVRAGAPGLIGLLKNIISERGLGMPRG